MFYSSRSAKCDCGYHRTATSVSLSWSVPTGTLVVSYTVTWQRDTSGVCDNPDLDSETITGSSTGYTILGQEEDSSYTITVTVFNAAGSSIDVDTAMTEEAGERLLLL